MYLYQIRSLETVTLAFWNSSSTTLELCGLKDSNLIKANQISAFVARVLIESFRISLALVISLPDFQTSLEYINLNVAFFGKLAVISIDDAIALLELAMLEASNESGAAYVLLLSCSSFLSLLFLLVRSPTSGKFVHSSTEIAERPCFKSTNWAEILETLLPSCASCSSLSLLISSRPIRRLLVFLLLIRSSTCLKISSASSSSLSRLARRLSRPPSSSSASLKLSSSSESVPPCLEVYGVLEEPTSALVVNPVAPRPIPAM
ncbi:hypothetical protein WICPIJ_002082 [Wickerhamomyces pijperi]|uniref:Uncharacterized protein n=1 Tax=Wickerhamomyces pijperi TaxID=599730 RepID=A0A9P8QAG3_WICPI|nr:hypothetical protein WICPIJ_002082 [Wickerhamomyces pijperi]